MSEIIDLNMFVGPPRQVKIGETVYQLPRDLPAELYLEVMDLQQRGDDLDEEAAIRTLHGKVLELFQVHQPEMDRLPAGVTIPMLVQMIGRVYRDADQEAEQAARPTRPKSGSRGTPSRKKTASRSRSSRS